MRFHGGRIVFYGGKNYFELPFQIYTLWINSKGILALFCRCKVLAAV